MSKDGRRTRLCDLHNEHLINILRMLKRKAEEELQAARDNAWENLATVRGEMATYYLEGECDSLDSATWECFVPPIFDNLMLEMVRRGIKYEDVFGP